MLFAQYQKQAHRTATTDDIEIYSLGLIGEAGGVASAIKKYRRDAPSQRAMRRDVEEELGDVLWYLSEIATQFEIRLDAVARKNLSKTRFLFRGLAKELDSTYPQQQRFPRRLEIRFDAVGKRLRIQADGKQIGDPLTDNAYRDDGYRYHDAFHLAYMTLLGWSPVMRRLLGCKRKKNRRVDEIEDGARARALEEGISILVFSQSPPPRQGPSLFSDESQIPFWLLENVKKMTADLEVKARSVTDWSKAIRAGFRIFDDLRRNRGGVVTCNLDRKRLTFRKR